MRKTLFFLFALFCLNICAQKMTISPQKNLSLDQINSQWQTRSIKLDGAANPKIMQLMQAFQKTWPTYSGGELIKLYRSNEMTTTEMWYDKNDKDIDTKNGYARYSEDDPDSENDEQLQTCVWRRSNGHSLFAVSLHRFSNEIDVLCFYDYNPQTKTLTPEKGLANLFKPSFPGYRYRVFLPKMGKNLTVEEFFGALTIKHTYSWDGMKPVNPQVTIDRFEFYQSIFSEKHFFADEHPLTKYALVDVDVDGFPELWLGSSDEEYQAVFSVKLTEVLLAGQDDRRTLSFYRGAVCHSGQCGAGCMSSNYCILKDSYPKTWLQDVSEYNMQEEDYSPSTYTIDGKEVSASKAESIIKSLGKEIEHKPRWIKLAI